MAVNWLKSDKKDKKTKMNGVSLKVLDEQKITSLEDTL